jgi:rhodanese-related sulfurtransferase
MSYAEVSPLEALNELDGYRVIDVREDHEFHGPLGFIECAELVPLSTFEANIEKLAGSRPLLFVCRSGKRSGMACEKLQRQGVDAATNLSGGMIDWNRAGLPVLHTEPKTLPALVHQIVAWTAQVGPLSPEAALEIAQQHLKQNDVPFESPTNAAVDQLIDVMGESLATASPPDLDLSLASFRRFLAVL